MLCQCFPTIKLTDYLSKKKGKREGEGEREGGRGRGERERDGGGEGRIYTLHTCTYTILLCEGPYQYPS